MVVGAFYQKSRIRLGQDVYDPGLAELTETFFGAPVEDVFGTPLLPGDISYQGFEDVEEEQLAAFGELARRVAPKWTATAGLKVTKSKVALKVLSEGPYAGGTTTTAAAGTQQETPVTPRLSLSYRPRPGILFYASGSKGYRAGGANPPVPAGPCATDLQSLGLSSAPTSFASDRLWNYESGSKTSTADGRFRTAVSLFRIDWDGIQHELEVVARPVPNLLLTMALGYVEARFHSTIEVAGSGGTSATIVERGDRVPHTLPWSLRLAMEYGAAVAPALRAYARSEYQYTGAYRRAPSERSVGYNPLTYNGDAYAEIRDRGRWMGDFSVRRKLIQQPVAAIQQRRLVPATGSPLRQTTLRPRTIGISATSRF